MVPTLAQEDEEQRWALRCQLPNFPVQLNGCNWWLDLNDAQRRPSTPAKFHCSSGVKQDLPAAPKHPGDYVSRCGKFHLPRFTVAN